MPMIPDIITKLSLEDEDYEGPWFVHAFDTRIVNGHGYISVERILLITNSSQKGAGDTLTQSQPYIVGDVALEKYHRMLSYLVGLHNEKVMPKPRNPYQPRDGAGKFRKKSARTP